MSAMLNCPVFFRPDFFANPADEVARDAALFRSMEESGTRETVRFWECSKPAVVLGSFGVISREVHEDACRIDNVPIIRRISGGGAVVIGRGCINYSLVLSLDERPELRSVTKSYEVILTRIAEMFALPQLAPHGLGDLAIGDQKVSGSAQRRGRRALLHHGTILYDFDISLMERYLKVPERQPAYRVGRSHGEFVRNVPLALHVIKERLARAWQADKFRAASTSKDTLK